MSDFSVRWPAGVTVRPLQHWPQQWEDDRRRAPFSASWGATLDLLDRELFHVDALRTVLQIAVPESAFRMDGYPRAQAKAEHPGVILSFDRPRHEGTESLSFPCDRFDRWQDNVRAIALALEALRKVDRYGITPNGEQYTGWRAIGGGTPMPGPMSEDEAWSIIGSFGDGPIEVLRRSGDARAALRRARGFTHPDRHAGDRTLWDQVERAAQALGLT